MYFDAICYLDGVIEPPVQKESSNMNSGKFSEERMKHYFANDLSYGAAFGFITVGIICIVVAVLAGKNLGQSLTLYAYLAGAALLAIGAFVARYIYYSIPSDSEYEAWVERNINEMILQATAKLHPDSPQAAQIIHSVVLPGTQAEKKGQYEEGEACMKLGKDKQWHYSLHDCIVLFPADHYLAAFNAKISALNQDSQRLSTTDEYFYRDIVGVTTITKRDSVAVTVKGQITLQEYLIEECSFKVSNGSTMEMGAAIGISRLQQKSKLPDLTISGVDPQNTVDRLRSLIRSKKQFQV